MAIAAIIAIEINKAEEIFRIPLLCIKRYIAKYKSGIPEISTDIQAKSKYVGKSVFTSLDIKKLANKNTPLTIVAGIAVKNPIIFFNIISPFAFRLTKAADYRIIYSLANILFDNIISYFYEDFNNFTASNFPFLSVYGQKRKIVRKGEHMDRRIQRTRSAIFDAFYKLIARRRYAKISIQNIIDEANIGRSTFYEHFETKDDLLRAMCTDLFEHIFEAHTEKSCHYFAPSSTFPEKLTHLLYHLLEDKPVIKGILSSESGEIFLEYFRRYFTNIVAHENIQVVGVPQEFVLQHTVGSFIEAVRWWVQRDFQESPETLSRYFIGTCKI